MRIDMGDLIAASELTRNTAFYVREAAAGRRLVILNNSVPKAALVSIEDLECLAQLDHPAPTPVHGSPANLLEALGGSDPATFEPRRIWAQTDATHPPLTVPIGTVDDSVYTLNLTRGISGYVKGHDSWERSDLQGMIVAGLCAQYSPSRLQVFIPNPGAGTRPRRSLDTLPHATTLAGTGTPAGMLGAELDRRCTATSLADEPELLVVLDDLVAGTAPLARLLDEGPQVGVHTLFTDANCGADNPLRRHRNVGFSVERIGLAAGDPAALVNVSAEPTRVQLFLPNVGVSGQYSDWVDLLADCISASAASVPG